MSTNVLLTDKLIGDIQGKFFVPKYQRGYRWTDTQVRTLLNDLWEHCNASVQKEYCLQPVVVRHKPEDNCYELIDGQQRFTTILILLLYIKDELNQNFNIKYTLEYETRPDTAKFLTDINGSQADDNIDFFHIFQAKNSIAKWLDSILENDPTLYKITILFRLLDYLTTKTKVIWYEVDNNEDPISLFTRLNIGRIHLTNAELIKALLLKNYDGDVVDRERQERSLQWDDIEKNLRCDNDELWYFITSKKSDGYPTRIELLFDMMANKKDNERDRYFTFFWFENEIKQRGVKNVWEDILRNFLQIKEWYADRVMYHKIGYLISSDSASMADILNIAKGRRKSELLQEIKTLIANSINFKLKEGDTYSDLNYEKNYKEINKLLLLFNVESIIAEEVYQRFPFGKYNTAEWSLEHIHAQNSQGLKNKDTQIEWIKMHIKSVKAVSPNGQYESLLNELETIVKSEKIESRGSFDELFNAVCNALSENTDTEYIHTISNMALLSRCDNSALNNSTFDVKRNQIIEMDKKGAFIPYCTKMVFLKYYTPSSDNQIHFWGERDREAYISAINKTLKPYLLLIDQTF
ncbi:MAG: DUF262 domain-containing protein [Alistipes sp.]|nr:DUF262 domain-containing protein [Alistipes sp.]